MERTPYTLKVPIQVGETGEPITQLDFRKPTAGDVRAIPLAGATVGDLLNVVGKLCAQPQAVVDRISAEDLIGITELVVDFLPSGLLTGLMR